MNQLQTVVIWTGIISTLAGTFGTILGVWAIFRRRDQDYDKQHQEMLNQKQRVERRLGGGRHNG